MSENNDNLVWLNLWSEKHGTFVEQFYNQTTREFQPYSMDEETFKARMQQRYPVAYETMQASGKDMVGWIYRNFIDLYLD